MELERIENIFINIVKGFLGLLLLYMVMRVIKCPLPYIVIVINDSIIFILFFTFSMISNFYVMMKFINFIKDNKNGKVKFIKEEIKKILIEITFLFILKLISSFISNFLIEGNSSNQNAVEAIIKEGNVISTIIDTVIFTSINEEFVFRFLPYKIIKNKKIYLIVTTFVFAAMHVLNDPKSLVYIWCYLPMSFYLTYIYYETQDLLLTISLHGFNNLLATIIILYF